ncbi:OsmC family protein [Pannonibacter sp. Q-1]|uniref:Peroxiredoxin n=1 Tax=Pannonibacter phragmitetus TaxID=121719 RepID=A0A0L0J2Z2_9HYPH|nr:MULTISPECIES: OsmC family protein [Pannonibacter]ALV25819.1 peroxiredoxin [Pannonibacter phragmitetus]KND19972.1 peroxiredoxin [Pannonibacter phragmitetus]
MPGHLYTAEVIWRREGEFRNGRYSRGHTWRFDGGVEVPASASPTVVPLPHSVPEAVDPEEAFAAAISSCHMMTFLDFARRDGFLIEAYEDRAEAEMHRIAPGRMGITRVTLRPVMTIIADSQPDPARLAELHEKAHEMCFIANSVKCEIVVAPGPVRLVAPQPHEGT